ncbi:MAG: 3-deoxy-manno-octulosonate cytidylyltransferase [Planctomycetaceae bacterium]|jgi:3-deoxy-manno-octulosonate cytidylyltransferase (CMP-KDO synthetase)|nr:3-deoxy-manno-octulosonate cytidylyltransferase [Planctomycetaceae bacterium]
MNNKSVVIIPARYASTRLPRKLLLDETGKPLIQYTYEAALRAKFPESVSVACDHQEIFTAVKKFGGTVFMTDPNAKSGTDRVAEVAAKMDDIDIVVNVQGDEPEIAGESIDLVIRMLTEHSHAVMATLATPIRNRQQLEDPACVKVVFDQTGRALYFSRSVIPYPRNGITTELFQSDPPLFYQHVGMYAYRRDFLLSLSRLPQSDPEKTESLEQLRVLHHGFGIMVGVVDEPTFGIDTPEDYRRFVEKLSCPNRQ